MGDECKEYMLYLENRTYRCLQQMAKSLGLPSNYKKVYLIELIHAKKFRSEDIVKTIIQKVKIERLLSSKKKRLKNNRKRICISPSTKSPSITSTPKCPRVYLPFNSEVQRAIKKHNSRRSLLNDIEQHNATPKQSDRVLRSFNLRQIRTPNYKIMNINNPINDMNKIQNTLNSKAVVKINTQTGNFQKFYLTADCVVKKHRPAILNTSSSCETKKPIILRQKDIIQNNYVAGKRQRTVSGIYPLVLYKNLPQNVRTTESVLMRKNDGSLTKINALIQKCDSNYKQKISYCNTEINIQDIIDSIEDNVTENTNNDLQLHPAIESCETVPPRSVSYPHMDNNFRDNEKTDYSLYHLNKMRQQMTYQRMREHTNNQQILPKINEVFSKFNNIKDVAQPLYVQVSSESELSQNYPFYVDRSNCNPVLLESLYNFKSHMLTNAPLLQIATTANTKSIFSTTTVPTARAHQSASLGTDAYNLYEQDNRYNMNDKDPRLYEFFKYSEQQIQQNTEYNRSTSSTDTFQECRTPATIPEMLEDAVELISQDGDYMEQIGMDVRVSCVICSWAGPKIILENHILKEHAKEIVDARGGEWRVSWSLGALARASRAHVLRHSAALYVLRAHYRDPERLAAALSSISEEPVSKLGVITVYNKLSGEPYTWRGYIQPVSVDESVGLKVNISQLELLPNSANLKLLNRELVSDSQNKVIVGAPALNDINIVMFVKIF